jgi:hypothetical protein
MTFGKFSGKHIDWKFLQVYTECTAKFLLFFKYYERADKKMKENFKGCKHNHCSLVSVLHFLKITLSRWAPWLLIQCFDNCLRFCLTPCNKAQITFQLISVMVNFSSWVQWGWVTYTWIWDTLREKRLELSSLQNVLAKKYLIVTIGMEIFCSEMLCFALPTG